MKAISSAMVLGSMALAVGAAHLQSRAAQSQAVCEASFSWMENSKGISPCQVVASIDATCNNGNWVITALNSSIEYGNPTTASGTASFCTCSWASYNLISACTACQGFPEQTPEWPVYSAGCPGLTTDNFFPSNITLTPDIAIPFWAQQDPVTAWTSQMFSASTAQQIANEGHPDFIGGTSTATTTTKHKSNIGAIVGGVIGGIVVIAAAAAVAFYIIRRQRQARGTLPGSILEKPGHNRMPSNMSTVSTFKSPGSPFGAAMFVNQPSSPGPTSNPSIYSAPYDTRSIITRGPSAAAYSTASPPPIPSHNNGRIEDRIDPFTAPPTMDSNIDRKQANGAFQVYDPVNAPPALRTELIAPHTPVTRARVNPPTYEDAAESSSSPQRPVHRTKQGSTDTTHSLTSSRSGERLTTNHSPSASQSGTMPNLAGQMGFVNRNIQEELVLTPEGHGRKVSTSRDQKIRPPEDSFNPRDLA